MRIIYLLPLVIALSFWSVAFAIQTDCFTSDVFFMWQLNDVFSCFEDRLDTLENAPSGSGNATLLNDLGDVVITSPSDNQFLRYDGTRWVNESTDTNVTKLCEVVASVGNNATLTCTFSTTVKAFYFQLYMESPNTNQWGIRFNNDSGTSYTQRSSTNGGADATLTSQSQFALITTVASQGYNNFFECDNPSINKEKHCYGFRTTSSTGNNADSRIEYAVKWVNTSSNISSINLVRTTGTPTLNSGSYIIAYGVS